MHPALPRGLHSGLAALRSLLVAVVKKRAMNDTNTPRTKFNDFSTLSLLVRAVFCRVVPERERETRVKWWAL